MALNKNLILVCFGSDVGNAINLNYPILDMYLGVTNKGNLGRFSLSTLPPNNYIGISDIPENTNDIDCDFFAKNLLFEAKRTKCRGIFADFERDSDISKELSSKIDKILCDNSIPFFVPLSKADYTSHAHITTDTAISGGSLQDMISEYSNKYGKHRISALLSPLCADFTLPSNNPSGNPLSSDERIALRTQKNSQVFFSKELCAKYFTYMDEDNQGHFVLFDDESTMQDKIDLLSRLGINHFFALYPDVKNMA